MVVAETIVEPAVAVGVAFGVVVDVAVAVVLVVGVTAAQAGRVMGLESRVTAALRASSRPVTDAVVLAVTEVIARTVPAKTEVVPSVAEPPTCHVADHGSVEEGDAAARGGDDRAGGLEDEHRFRSPWASRVCVPVRPRPKLRAL